MAERSRKPPHARRGAQMSVLTACLAGLAAVAACRAPTEITIEMSTDVRCADVRGTSITIGTLASLDDKPATTVTPVCDPSTGRIGSMVIVPSGSKDDTVAIKVVMGVGRDPAECVPPAYGPGCIVARRALHFIPSASLSVPIFMAAVCGGIPCNSTETCVGGNCTDATIDDSSKCEDPGGCGESALGPMSRGDAGGGGGDDAADAALVAVSPDAATIDAADAADAALPGVVSLLQAAAPALVDVTAEGTIDWMHWGYNGVRFDRKLGGSAIQTYTLVGTVTQTDSFNNDPVSFSWTGGDPTPSVTNTPTHVHIRGTAMGFSISVDASPTMRTATFYVGGYMTHGRFTASLSDGSAMPVSADAQNFTSGNGYSERFDVPFSAPTPGVKLIASWVLAEACTVDCTMRLSTVTLH